VIKIAKAYYGDKISENMIETPEGYLVCQNVPIGRTGWMEYLGQELPADFNIPYGAKVKVYRSPEELFSPETIASFEGKAVTNTHPTSNLTLDTTAITERGHAQNVRRDGDFLIADLYVKDPGLIDEIMNKRKRETSSGYDCSWVQIGDGKYEQREIIGNHIAIVPSGRAGPKVSIKDSKPDNKQSGGKNMKITQKFLAAIGLKHFVQDAEPEDIAKAMDAMSECEEPKKEVKPDEAKAEAKDEDPAINADLKEMKDQIAKLTGIIEALVQSDKDVHKELGAQESMDALEADLDKEVKDEKPEDKETLEDEAKESAAEQKKEKEEDTEKHKFAADAAIKQFVKDMKPVIMAIPDEKTRNEVAKKFVASVQDSRTVAAQNGYADILAAAAKNKKAAMDKANNKQMSTSEAAGKACDAWKAAGEKLKGGNK
jgi:hypothetical protein